MDSIISGFSSIEVTKLSILLICFAKICAVYFLAALHGGDDFVWNPVLTILTLILENFPSY